MKRPSRNVQRSLNNATSWNQLIFDTDLPAPAKLIACYLRTHMNDYQEIAFPSVSRIAGYTSQSERTVQAHLGKLCNAGYLQKIGIHHKYSTNIYSITTPAADAPPQQIPSTPAGAAPKLNKVIKQVSLSSKFTAPSAEELRQYQAEKGFTFDPEVFIDYWASVGWKRGRTQMKDWRATARNWARNENSRSAVIKKPNSSARNQTLEQDLNDTSWAQI